MESRRKIVNRPAGPTPAPSRWEEARLQLLESLRRHWGYDTLRSAQEEVLHAVAAGLDTLVLMPTGGGKSLTYQLPGVTWEGLTLVVTPLIALMKDQVDRLRKQGIRAAAIHSGLSLAQIDRLLDNCVYGDVKFLYIAPERLTSESFRLRVRRMPVRLIAVDEAHCISQWGYDFRPAYLRIAELRERLPKVPVLALTASATPAVAEDIMRRLHFAEPHVIRGSFARPNLSYSVREVEEKNEQLLRVVRNVGGAGIVYVRTREGAEQVAAMLRDEGIPAEYYHGGLLHSERTARQERWTRGEVPVMVATNAFGMGIDKSDVRYVVHYAMCDSLESYYQEAGRTGRDGQRSYAVLLVGTDDRSRIAKRFEADYPPIEQIRAIYDALGSYLQIAIGDGAQTVHTFDLRDFCARHHLYSGTVLCAIKILQQNGYLTLTDEAANPARIHFCVGRDDLYRLRVVRDDLDHIIRTLLRLYDGVFTDFRPIDEGEIARWSGYTPERVRELLKRLWQLRVIRYIPSNHSPLLVYEEERLPVQDLYIAPESYKLRHDLALERFERMTAYAADTEECRSVILQRYFGDPDPAPCGVCDRCLERKRAARGGAGKSADAEVIAVLDVLADGPLDPQEVAARLRRDPAATARLLDRLVAEEKISVADDGKVARNR